MKKIISYILLLSLIFVAVPSVTVQADTVSVTADEGWQEATYDPASTVLTNVSEGYSFKISSRNDSASTAILASNGVQTAAKIVIPSAFFYNGKNYTISGIRDYILGNPNTLVEQVIISEGITQVGNAGASSGAAQTFRSATGLKSVKLPSTLTALSSNCFMGCTNLLSIDIPEGVTTIPSQAFSGCTALAEVTFHGTNLTTVDNSSFTKCSSLSVINNFPSSVTTIGSSAFSESGITEFVVPAGVTEIKNSTFSNAKKLRSVVFMGNITSLGTEVFKYSELTVITFEGDTAPSSLGSFGRYDGKGLVVYYPVESTGYDAAEFRAFFTNTTFAYSNMYNTIFINISPGSSEAELNATWYCIEDSEEAIFQIALKTEGTDFPAEGVKSFTATQEETASSYLSNKATATGLLPNTEYVYRVGNGTIWSPVYSYRTRDLTSFDFLFTTDTHIGAKSVDADGIGWMDTLSKAAEKYPEASLLLSSGDQADKGTDQQFNKFFESPILRNLAIAAMGGSNHDDTVNFKYHFNMPNLSNYGISTSGSDYYFTYGDALFMVLNTNVHSSTPHIDFMNETVAANPNYKWKFVMFHHSIFSACTHSTSSYIVDFRNKLSPVITALGVDAVFMGHDHGNVRTYIMNGTTPQKTQTVDDDERIVNATGVQYITGNSSSGNKYYDLVDPVQPWAQVRSQLYVPSFSGISVKGNALTISTYRTDTMELMDSVTLCKEDALSAETANVLLSADKDTLPMTGGEVQLALTAKQGTGIDLQNASVTYETTEDGTLAIDQNGRVTLKKAPQKDRSFRIWAKVTAGGQTYISNAVTVRVKNKPADFSILTDQITFIGIKDHVESAIHTSVHTLPNIDELIVNVPVIKDQPTDKNLAILAALYKGNELVAIRKTLMNQEDDLMDIGTEYSVQIKLSIPDGINSEDLYAKVFFWNDFANLIPIRLNAELAN